MTTRMMLWTSPLSVLFFLAMLSTQSFAAKEAVFECPQKWSLIGTHCYYFVDVHLNFREVKDVCETYGSKLTIIRDEVESHDVGLKAKLYFKSNANFWIGNNRVGKHYDDDDDDDDYDDYDGMNKTASMYGYWQAKQPNYNKTKGPNALTSNLDGRWMVDDADKIHPFVCRTPACLKGMFRCSNGMCINKKWTCDGYNDCMDHSDESDCSDHCTKRYYQSSGSIVTGYENSAYCKWTIEGMPWQILKLDFHVLDLEKDVDILTVYAGGPTPATSYVLDTLTGRAATPGSPMTMYSYNNFLILELRSDASVSTEGINVTWSAVESINRGRVIDVKAGSSIQELRVPNPSNGPWYLTTEWNIHADEGELITLEITSRASKDLVLIESNGIEIDIPDEGRYVVISTDNNMRLVVETEGMMNKGFEAKVKSGCDVDIEASYLKVKTHKVPPNHECKWKITNPHDYKNAEYKIIADEIMLGNDSFIQMHNGSSMMEDSLVFSWNSSHGEIEEPRLIGHTVNSMLIVYHSGEMSNWHDEIDMVITTLCPPFQNQSHLMESYAETSSSLNETYHKHFWCVKGYSFRQEGYDFNLTATCSPSGVWTFLNTTETRSPSCQDVYCGLPPMIENGLINSTDGSVKYKGEATYRCANGFSLQGSKKVICEDDGHWSEPPVCKAEGCTDYPEVANADLVFEHGDKEYGFGTIIKVECHPGYELIGADYIVCLRNMTWSSQDSHCQILRCPLPHVYKGKYTNTALPRVNQTRVITCDSGFEPSDDQGTVNCNEDRTLSPETKCKDINECEDDNACNDRQVCVNHPGGKTCLCKPGYNGTNCIKIAADPYPHCTGGDSNKECTCETGYELFTKDGQNGYLIPTPKEDGLMDGDVLRINRTCIRTTCDLPMPAGEGDPRLMSSKTHQYFEDVLEWHCPLHYELDGLGQSTCQVDGFGDPPVCNPLKCPLQTDTENVYNRTWDNASGNEYMGGTFAMTKCKDPRAEEYDPFVRRTFCVSQPDKPFDYVYQGDSHICPGLDCGAIKLPGLDATVTGYSTEVDSMVTINCDSSRGFTLVGNSSVGQNQAKCGKNGRWDLGTMFCQGPRCQDPGTVSGTKQIAKDGYEMDQIVYYECTNSGYTLVPATPLLCIYDSVNKVAKWNDTAPTCFDYMDPVITCPNDVSFDLYEKITFDLPTYSDNSGHVYMYQQSGPYVNINNITKNDSLTFRAHDHNQYSECTVKVSINDRSAPTIKCIGPQDMVMSQTEMAISSNSSSYGVTSPDAEILMTTSGSWIIEVGETKIVRASVTKDNGLMKECAFSIVGHGCLNATLLVSNGNVESCLQTNTIHTCNIVCDDGYVLPNKQGSTVASCDSNDYINTWTREPSFYNCYQTFPQIQTMSGKFYYESQDLIFAVPDQCKTEFQNAIRDEVNNLKGVCGEYTFAMSEVQLLNEGAKMVSLDFTLRVGSFDDNATALQECVDKLLAGKTTYFQTTVSASESFRSTCKYPWNTVTEPQEFLQVESATCDDRQEAITLDGKTRCVPCLPGYRWNSVSKSCSICEKLQYTSQPNQDTCSEVCDFDGGDLGSLASDGITGKDGCPAFCPTGFTSSTGFIKDKCNACPEDTYWVDSKTCSPCPNEGSTLGRQAVTIGENACHDPCPAGHYSITGYAPCTPCPVNLYQPQKGQTECLECPGSKTTEGEGSTSQIECIDFACTTDCEEEGRNEDGSCVKDYHTSTCNCKPGYIGHRCENKIDPCNPNPCYGGTCKDNTTQAGYPSYVCECYIDEDCIYVVQPRLDYNAIDTTDYDIDFSLEECEQSCKNSPTCKALIYEPEARLCWYFRSLDYLDPGVTNTHGNFSKEKQCTGEPLFAGDRCEKDLKNDCKDDTCAERDFCHDLVNDAECVCPPGVAYLNDRCEVASDPCSTVKCENGGKCVGFGDVRYHCSCPIGFTGDLCQTNIDDCTENTCLYGGTCKDGNNDYECECPEGYSGKNCEVMPDVCDKANCQGGKCVVFGYPNISAICFCPDHYEWPSREEKNNCVMTKYCESSPCANNAECSNILGGYSCKCPEGFNGAQCQHNINDCTVDSCQNGGVCHDRVASVFCDCPLGFEGERCEININDCQGQCENSVTCEDLIMDYKCKCQPGYGGKNCSDALDLCESAPCQHGGNCSVNGVNSYLCACEKGWTGDNCESRMDYCEDACVNSATCYSLNDKPYCRCKEGTAGDNCGVKADMCKLFNPFLCVHGACENKDDGSAQCVCEGEITSCAIEQHKRLKFRIQDTAEVITDSSLESCRDRCINNDECESLILSSGTCFLYKDVVESDSNGVYKYAGVKRCRFDPHYSGKSCQLVKEMCHKNPCGVDEDQMGMCSVDGFGFSCDCSNLDNYEGDRCQTPVEVCKQSTCPSGAKCLPYMDQGKLTPACLCQPDEILAGSTCKKVDNNFDMMFPVKYKNDSLVTSVRGFVTSDVMTISMWIAFFEESDDWFIAIAEAGRKHDPNDNYEPLIKIHNSFIQLSYNGSKDVIPLKDKLSREHKWHFFSFSLNGMGQYQIVNDVSTYGFDTKEHEVLNVTLPHDKYFFVHIGHGFSGYISQLHVWNSVVSIDKLLDILPDHLYVPDPSELAMRWTMYHHNKDITPVYPSRAMYGTSVCALPTTDVTSVEHCPVGDDIPDKKSPKVRGTCEKSTLLVPHNGSNQVTLGRLNINFDEGVKLTNVPINALSFGAHDVAVTSTDMEGNAGVCMTRVYVTTNECSDTIPWETKPIDKDDNRKSVCYDNDLHPSIPTPYVFSCGELRSYNLDDMFTPHYMIPCGEEDDLYVTLKTNLVYSVGVSCVTIDVSDDFVQEMNKDILAVNKSGWHICVNNCIDTKITAECNPDDNEQILVEIILKDLPTVMGNYVDGIHVDKSPEDMMRHLVDIDAFNAKSISFASMEKDLVTYNSSLLCRFGYGRMNDACVECGPGSYYTKDPQLCHLCPQGTYSNMSKVDICMSCGEGKTTLQMGTQNVNYCVDKCPAGQMYNTFSHGCDLCPPSFYQDEAGQGYCKPCPPTTGTDGSGAESKEDCQEFCPPGQELIERVCVDCQKGYFRIGNLQDRCGKCPQNYTTLTKASSDVSQCNVPKCPVGFFVDDSGAMMKCKECDYGTYQSEEAEFKCEKCKPGYTTNYTMSVNSSDCIFTCGQGSEQDGPESCRLCSSGYYKDSSMESRFEMCSPCPDMTFTTEGKGAYNKSQCVVRRCFDGTYHNASDNLCYDCPVGTYQSFDQQEKCEECKPNFSTMAKGSNSSEDCKFTCPEGYEIDESGSDCRVCPRGSFKTKSMRFDPCMICQGNTTEGNGATSADDCVVANCSAGYVVSKDLSRCVPCEYDTYQPDNEPYVSTACIRCSGSTGTDHIGSNSSKDCKKKCSAGQGLVDNQCIMCVRGTWNNGNITMRFEECAQCPSGNTTEVISGASGPEYCIIPMCEAGQVIKDGVCKDCEIDSYQPIDKPFLSTKCKPCEGQTGTDHSGADSAEDCMKTCVTGRGYDSEQKVCSLCKEGTWNNGNVTMRFEECALCPEGYTTSVELGATKIEDCDLRDCKPGSFFDKADECIKCPIGTYQSEPRQSKCINCPVNKNTSVPGAASRDDCLVYCLAGKEDDGNGQCVSCKDDYYKPMASFSTCLKCQGDVTSTPENRLECTESFCDMGRYRDGDCVDCAQGFYKEIRGDMACQKCPGNKTTTSTGATSLKDCSVTHCEAGYYSPNDIVCLPCEMGYYKEALGNAVCTKCEGNFTTVDKASTQKTDCNIPICPSGQYRSGLTCVKCSIGTYQPDSGTTQCLNCTEGFTTVQTASTSEDHCRRVCPVGQYRDDDDNMCYDCAIGFYQDMEGMTSCVQCPGNYTTFVTSASKEDQCNVVCPQGYYRAARDQCIECPLGKYQDKVGEAECHVCPQVNAFPASTKLEASTSVEQCLPLCSQGLYLNITERSCYECPVGTFKDTIDLATKCNECPEGTTTLSTRSKNKNDCSYALCPRGYYRKLNEQECQKCDYGTYQPMDDTQTTSCTPCGTGQTTLVLGATGDKYCLTDCNAGLQYSQDIQKCIPCPVGQFRNKPVMMRCYYCPDGKTTLTPGSDACIDTDVLDKPVTKTKFTVRMYFRANNCDNQDHLHGVIRAVIRNIIRDKTRTLAGLCPNTNCDNIEINFEGNCGPRAGKRKRDTSGDIATDLTLNNVDSRLTDLSNNLKIEPETAIQDSLRDMTSQQDLLDANGLNSPSDIQVTVTCQSGSILKADGRTCEPCAVGTYHNTSSNTCMDTPKGTYTDKEGSSTPTQCPDGMTTENAGSTSSDKCDGLCVFNVTQCVKGSCGIGSNGKSSCQCNNHYSGVKCDQYTGESRSNDDTEILIGGIAGGIGLFLLIILLIVGIINCRPKRSSFKRHSESSDSDSVRDLKSHNASVIGYQHPYFMNAVYSGAAQQPVLVQDPTMYQASHVDYYQPVYHNKAFESSG